MKKMLLAAAAGAAVLAISAPASAATTIAVTNSPFTGPAQGGGFVGLSGGIFGYSDGVFNFTFDLTTSLKTYVQMQISGAQVIPYSLFKGPVGSGSLVATSSTPDSFTQILSAGSYYLQTTIGPPSGAPGSFDTISGAVVTSAVPEPAVWATLIMGFFGVGAYMRRARKLQATPVAA